VDVNGKRLARANAVAVLDGQVLALGDEVLLGLTEIRNDQDLALALGVLAELLTVPFISRRCRRRSRDRDGLSRFLTSEAPLAVATAGRTAPSGTCSTGRKQWS
jgi:hypothetical protein